MFEHTVWQISIRTVAVDAEEELTAGDDSAIEDVLDLHGVGAAHSLNLSRVCEDHATRSSLLQETAHEFPENGMS